MRDEASARSGKREAGTGRGSHVILDIAAAFCDLQTLSRSAPLAASSIAFVAQPPLPTSRLPLAAYESVTYDSKAMPLAEPDAVAAMAILHGVTPVSPERCRVLELGCATAGNLLSMAFRFPSSRFVGVDLSPAQIEIGRLAVSEMGLQNVTLEARDLAEIGDECGQFDYIICHGVYSWVGPDVQDAILGICERSLSPNGIAYVSYNTYPGWHRRGMLRDMLMFNDDPSLPPDRRLHRARQFAAFLGSVDPSLDSPHAAALRDEATQVQEASDQILFHEHLAPWNEPVYFAEFARRAATHGLQYLSEGKLVVDTPAMTRARDAFGQHVDPTTLEQHLDFASGRAFRRTLLCREGIQVARTPNVDAVRKLFARARGVPVAPSPEDAARGGDVASFRTPNGATITTNNPLVVSTLRVLGDVAPEVVGFDDLRRRVNECLAASTDDDVRRLAEDEDALPAALLQCAKAGFAEFRASRSRFVVRPGARPKASALARWQSRYVDEVAALGHWPVKLLGAERFLLQYLDGANDRPRLLRQLEHAFTSGDLRLGDAKLTPDQVVGVLDDLLERLGRSALLLA